MSARTYHFPFNSKFLNRRQNKKMFACSWLFNQDFCLHVIEYTTTGAVDLKISIRLAAKKLGASLLVNDWVVMLYDYLIRCSCFSWHCFCANMQHYMNSFLNITDAYGRTAAASKFLKKYIVIYIFNLHGTYFSKICLVIFFIIFLQTTSQYYSIVREPNLGLLMNFFYSNMMIISLLYFYLNTTIISSWAALYLKPLVYMLEITLLWLFITVTNHYMNKGYLLLFHYT